MNANTIGAIYVSELARAWNSLIPGFAAPVISTALYFVVFGSLNAGAAPIEGINYASFIVPGLVMLTIIMDAVSTAGFGIYIPKESGAIYEILAAPVSPTEFILGYGGATLTKEVALGGVMLATARVLVPYTISHPICLVICLIVISALFSMFGLILGIWASGWQKLMAVTSLILTPLTFLSGAFYSIVTLPPILKGLTYINPMSYIASGFRWCFFGSAFIDIRLCWGVLIAFLLVTFLALARIVASGYKLRS